jgi:cation diffusion facilitator CzcD-associated flavoprotein CzcO
MASRMVSQRAVEKVDVCIVGSGVSGIGMAVNLLREGKRSFVILEKAESVGGTWRDNTYPGCACDVSSQLYSFSFAPKPDWARMYAAQPEIRAYLEACVEKFGIRPFCRFGAEVARARYDSDAAAWTIEAKDGRVFHARLLVFGVGGLHQPALPDLPGLQTFEGNAFHSSRWNHSASLHGKSVAVIGTGASAIQFIPKIQPQVSALHVYQRTPAWIVSKTDTVIAKGVQRAFARFPPLQKALRFAVWARSELFGLTYYKRSLPDVGEYLARKHLEDQVPEGELRAALTPNYRAGCKRLLISNDFYPAIAQSNVSLITHGIREITKDSVITGDGTERKTEIIVYGTGFHATRLLEGVDVVGTGDVRLADVWKGSPEAFLGITVTGFPNLFLLMGPNTALGHNSVLTMIEAQIAYVMSALAMLEKLKARALEVRADRQAAFVQEVQARLEGTVWQSGCKSWYQAADGKNRALWPGSVLEYIRRTKRLEPSDYRFL